MVARGGRRWVVRVHGLSRPDEGLDWLTAAGVADRVSEVDEREAVRQEVVGKYFGARGEWWIRRLNAWVKRAIDRSPGGYRLGPCTDLGRVASAPTFSVGGHADVALLGEIAGNPLFTLAAGTLVTGGEWRLSESMWEQLWDGIYYCRLVEPRSLESLGYWSFQKSSETRQQVGNAL